MDSTKITPLVKWPGGKKRMLRELGRHVPPTFGRYFEPFFGGGAMFCGLASEGKIKQGAVIGDMSLPLIRTYRGVAEDVTEMIQNLAVYDAGHSDELFAQVKRWVNENPDIPDALHAARFVYLNKTCFNGLWRTNKKGEFNSPKGKFK